MKKRISLFVALFCCIVEVFAQGTWVQEANFGGGNRRFGVGITIGDKGYAGFGLDATNQYYNDWWKYDINTNSWRQITTFPGSERSQAFAFSICGEAFVGTGLTPGASSLSDLWKYVPDSSALVIPNIFTPNDDGINDVFKISGLNKCDEYTLKIFDRWGIKMFETDSPFGTFWDGTTTSGLKTPAGVYYYVLTGKANLSGFIHLLR